MIPAPQAAAGRNSPKTIAVNAEPVIKIRRLRPQEDADIPLPCYMTADAAGMDICAAVRAIGLINAPGTVDADYRGEVMIALVNLGPSDYTVRRGDRIAQMVIQRVHQARLEVVDVLDATPRSEGGFGHTGN